MDAIDTADTPGPPLGAGDPARSQARSWLEEHPVALDAALAVLVGLPGVLAANFAEGGPQPVAVLAALGAGVALMWRRRRPLTVVAVVAALWALAYPTSLVLPAAVAVYTAASLRSGRWAAASYAMAVALPMLGIAVRIGLGLPGAAPGSAPSATWGVSVVDPVLIVALCAGLLVRSRRERRRAQAEALARRIDAARAAERTRIAAEMHDVVGHGLTVMIALANGAAAGWRTDPERAALALRHLSEVGAGALSDLQRTLRVLREDEEPDGDPGQAADDRAGPEDGDDTAGPGTGVGYDLPSLEDLVAVSRAAGLPVVLTRTGPPLPPDAILRTNVYRIVQEALTNVLRHAEGVGRVEVRIARENGRVHVSVSDDGRARASEVDHGRARIPAGDDRGGSVPAGDGGRGSADGAGTGRGLIGIGERAAGLGGTSRAGPRTPTGWQVTVDLPVADPNGTGAASSAVLVGDPVDREGTRRRQETHDIGEDREGTP